MFADDIILFSKSAAGQTLEIFCSKLKLEVNTEKTKACVLGTNKNHLLAPTYLESVSEYKYLGVWITGSGKVVKAKGK